MRTDTISTRTMYVFCHYDILTSFAYFYHSAKYFLRKLVKSCVKIPVTILTGHKLRKKFLFIWYLINLMHKSCFRLVVQLFVNQQTFFSNGMASNRCELVIITVSMIELER